MDKLEKKEYVTPTIEIITIEEDIIRTSALSLGDNWMDDLFDF